MMTDKQLIRVARDFRDGILGGRSSHLMCFAIAAPLQGFLSAVYGVESTLEEIDFGDMNHVWLRLSDNRILDPTADQFSGMPPVYLGDIPEPYRSKMVVK